MFNGQTLFDRTMRVKMDNPSAGKAEPLPDGLKGLGPSLTNLQQMSCKYNSHLVTTYICLKCMVYYIILNIDYLEVIASFKVIVFK
jgi:hypothetical protein